MPLIIRRVAPVLILLGLLSGGVDAKPRERSGRVARQKAMKLEPSSSPRLRFNRRTGHYEQRVRVTNDRGVAIAGFQLLVSGAGNTLKLLTGKRAPGGGTYFHDRPLPAGKSVTIILRYQPKPGRKARNPEVSRLFVQFPQEPPPIHGGLITGGPETSEVAGTVAVSGTGCQILSGSGRFTSGSLTLSVGYSDSRLVQELGRVEVGGDLVVGSAGSSSEWVSNSLNQADPASALLWLESLQSGARDNLIPLLWFIDPNGHDPWSDDFWAINTEDGRRGGRDGLIEIERFEVQAGDVAEIFFQTRTGQSYLVQFSDDGATWETRGEIVGDSDTISSWVDPEPSIDAVSRLYRVVSLTP
jgi:hypothetical protein